ncbi:MAG: class I SAM-dependent methyltransferase [Thermoanaerobaculia bacterium]|nr:class I SAM-dependent methyltransferase [Thermoanaerobaculia bacterium]
MPRLHLLEIEDQTWCPRFLRDAATDLLAFVENSVDRPYHHFVGRLIEALEATSVDRIVDLCSGGGGPLPTLSRLLDQHGHPVSIRLTDLHPNIDRLTQLTRDHENFEAEWAPVDATNVPEELAGMRLLCEGFHHFRPDDARSILQDAVDQGVPIAILELVARAPGSILGVLLSPPIAMLGTLFLRPFTWKHLLFGIFIPLIPFLIVFDGVVSCLRIYSPAELQDLVDGVRGSEDYVWHIERRRFGLGWTTTLVAWPQSP